MVNEPGEPSASGRTTPTPLSRCGEGGSSAPSCYCGGVGGVNLPLCSGDRDDASTPQNLSADESTGYAISDDDDYDVSEEDGVFDTDLDSDDSDSPLSPLREYVQECDKLGVTPVKYFQRHFHDKIFVMRNHGLGPLGMKALSKSIERNIYMEEIDLEGNQIEAAGAKYLAAVLKDNVSVKELILPENGIRGEGAASICEMLAENTNINSVDLSGNLLRDCDGRHFRRLLKVNCTLRRLRLRHNALSTTSADDFRDALSSTEHLQLLDLSWNHFRFDAAVHLADMIKSNYGLKTLNLSMNGLSDYGAQLIGESLKQNQCLSELNLASNRITATGAHHIGLGLQANDALQTLRIGHNSLGIDGSLELLQSINKNAANTAMTLLDITNVVVIDAFEQLHERINNSRGAKAAPLAVTHGGILFRGKHCIFIEEDTDPKDAFQRDPMTKLRNYALKAKYRLIDVFRQFDTDNSWTLTRDKLFKGVKKSGLDITSEEVDVLMSRLDLTGEGIVYYAEMASAELENRKEKRRLYHVLVETNLGATTGATELHLGTRENYDKLLSET